MSELNGVLPQELEHSVESEQVIVNLKVDADIDFFKGHFPQAPVLPGVAQLDWAIHYARKYLSLSDAPVKNVEALKFQVVITPNQEVTLDLVQKSETKFTFKFCSEKGTHASGRIVLEAN